VHHIRASELFRLKERMWIFEKRDKELCLFQYRICGAVENIISTCLST
jgi:hypothetical protein